MLVGPAALPDAGDLVDVLLGDFREVLHQFGVGHHAFGQVAADAQNDHLLLASPML